MRGHREGRGAGTVGLLVRAGAGLAVLAALAGAARAAVPLDAVAAATGEGGNAFAASVLRALSGGALVAALCVVQLALLAACFKGVRSCLRLVRGRRPLPGPARQRTTAG